MRFAAQATAGLALWAAAAHAQLVPSTSATSAPAVDPMERAQRQADNVMRWIKVHADKPRAAPSKPAEPSAKPAPVPEAPKIRSVAAPVTEPPKPPAAIAPEPSTPPPSAVQPALPTLPEPEVVDTKETAPEPSEEDAAPLKAIALEQPTIPPNVLSILNAATKIVVQFTVETNGSVSDIKVLSSGRSQLNKPTIAAINRWRFEPIKTPRVEKVEFTFAP